MHGSDLNRCTADVQFDGGQTDLQLLNMTVALLVAATDLHATQWVSCNHCNADLPSLPLQLGTTCNSWHSTRRTCECPTRACCRILMLMLHGMCTGIAIAVY